MKSFTINLFCFLFYVVSFAQNHGFSVEHSVKNLQNSPVKLIPYPAKVNWYENTSNIQQVSVVEEENLSENIQKALSLLFSEHAIQATNQSPVSIRFLHKNMPREAYELAVNNKQIIVKASSDSGRYYAIQTIRQLITKKQGKPVIQACRIIDQPAFPMRGFMIDVGRNFQTIEFLKRQLDILAAYKFNTFQWHLTDYPAWRIESNSHPELIKDANHRKTRDPGKFYSFDEIRELFRYAKARHIQIIPEIDMPGHSTYFKNATGVAMESEKGIQILKEALTEFFDEIPFEMCPTIHIGSDEVEIGHPKVFMNTMVNFVRSHNREVMVWNPGLPVGNTVIKQVWKPDAKSAENDIVVDSWNSYINNSEPLTQIPKLLFKPIGSQSKGDVLGGILCLWHDVNLDNNEEILKYNPVYPAILTYSWQTWTGGVTNTSTNYLTTFPQPGAEAYSYVRVFEQYLLYHKQRFFADLPFQYAKQSHLRWTIEGPYKIDKNEQKQPISKKFKKINATGGTIIIRDRFQQGGVRPDAKPGETYLATTYIYSDKSQQIPVWVGFETALRANRIYQGLPEQGSWDVNGGTIFINGEKLPPPVWKHPGFQLSTTSGWGSPVDKEIPWTSEEFYWTRPPVQVSLQKGWNSIKFLVPGTNLYQNWMFTFLPLQSSGLRFATNPQ